MARNHRSYALLTMHVGAADCRTTAPGEGEVVRSI